MKLIYEVIPTIFDMKSDSRRFKTYEEGDFSSLADEILYDHYEDEFDENNGYLDVETFESMYEDLLKVEFDEINDTVEKYFQEMIDFTEDRPGKIIVEYEANGTRYLAVIPATDRVDIEDFFNEMGVGYSINPDFIKEMEDVVDTAEEQIRDAHEYEKDPFAYYGVSRY